MHLSREPTSPNFNLHDKAFVVLSEFGENLHDDKSSITETVALQRIRLV
ncbi:hypothetical protein [Anaplasma bovis]